MKLDMLEDELWKDVEEIVLFGYGRQGRRLLNTLQQDFKVVAIVENDAQKAGITVNGIPVLFFGDAVEVLRKSKVIVTTAEYHYKEIKKQLMEIGLTEYKDFVMYQPFIMEWYYKYKKKIYVTKTDVTVTSLCSLKCEKCTLFMPYWKNKTSFDLRQLKADADSYFRCVDFVLDMNIVGGEPFLYKELDEILSWYGEYYRDKIGYLGIITNGTIIPKESTLEIIKKYNISVSISDYSEAVKNKSHVDELCEVLEEKKIEYVTNSKIQWFDFGFPQNKYCYEGDAAKVHMEHCNTICHCLNEGKLYYCATAWAAYKAGLYPEGSGGIIRLDEIDEKNLADRKRILDCCSGDVKGGFIDFCRVCGGYGDDNGNQVETAVQLKE